MKLVTYARNQSISCGILLAGQIVDILSVWQRPSPPRSVKEILQTGPSCLVKLAELANHSDILPPLDSVKLLPPIPHPSKV